MTEENKNKTPKSMAHIYLHPLQQNEQLKLNVDEDNMEFYQEDALLADEYGVELDGPYKTNEQKLEKLRYLKSQAENKEYCPYSLKELYPGVQFLQNDSSDWRVKSLQESKHQQQNSSTLKESYRNVHHTTNNTLKNLNDSDRNDPNRNKIRKAYNVDPYWLIVPMPRQFNYTGCIMVNNGFQGLLHTYLRHGQDWINFVSNLDDLTSFSGLKEYVNRIRASQSVQNSREMINEYFRYKNSIDESTTAEVESTIMSNQLEIHRFLINNLSYDNYLGEGTNPTGKQQVYFRVQDLKGNVKVITICVSDQLYPPDREIGDDRPIRTIITIFFITWEEYRPRHLVKLF